MGTTLATKQDLQLFATKTELMALKQDVQLLRQEMVGMRTELRQEIENRFTLLVHEITTLRGDIARDLKALGLKMTVSLGSMLMLGFGLTITALRAWL